MSKAPAKRLGIIGFGSFGQFAAQHLADHFEVVVADLVDRADRAGELGIGWSSLEEAAGCPYVVFAVPVQSLADAIRAAGPHLQPEALILDVGSVKIEPVRQMVELLPEAVEIIGTHPMFGPQSAADGLDGHRIVMCPVRTTRAEQVQAFFEKLGLEVIVCDAETHDRDIAQTQALAQFVGRALAALDRSESAVRTPGYNHLRNVAETVGEDSWELFTAIQNINPYARDMRSSLMRHMEELQERLATDPEPGSGSTGDRAATMDPPDEEP